MKALRRFLRRLFRNEGPTQPPEVARRLKRYEMERAIRFTGYRAAWQKAWDAEKASQRRSYLWSIK